MNKIALLLTAALVAGFVSVRLTDSSSVDADVMDNQQVEEKMANYRSFKQVLEDSIEALADRSATLRDAQRRVHEAARRFQPAYLEAVARTESGLSSELCVAQNLVAHLRNLIDVAPNTEIRVNEIDRELAELQQ